MFLLGDKCEDYGKQKCWASIGWGFSSIILGWVVDLFSVNKKDKDYSAIFYSSIILTIVNFFVISKIKVRLIVLRIVIYYNFNLLKFIL